MTLPGTYTLFTELDANSQLSVLRKGQLECAEGEIFYLISLVLNGCKKFSPFGCPLYELEDLQQDCIALGSLSSHSVCAVVILLPLGGGMGAYTKLEHEPSI